MTTTTLDGISTPFVVASGATDIANDGDALVLLGTIDNLGTLSLNGTGTPPNGAPDPADFAGLIIASPTVTLTGDGTLELANQEDSDIYGADPTLATLVNESNTIDGVGIFGFSGPFALSTGGTAYPVALVNGAAGVIDATGTLANSEEQRDDMVIWAPSSAPTIVNDGLIEATAIGGLEMIADTIDQSGGGTLLASGSNDVLDLSDESFGDSTDIIGGTLDITNGGTIAGFGTLDGSTSAVTLAGGATLTVSAVMLGTIDNDDTLVLPSEFGGALLLINGPSLTFGGDGALELNGGNVIGAGGSLATLVNVGNTISGFGAIGIPTIENSSLGPIGGAAPVALTNEAAGVIDASDTANPLAIFGGGASFSNAGLLEATGAGGLTITDASLDNSGTLLASGAGAVVSLSGVSLVASSITSSGGGIIEFSGTGNTFTAPDGTLTITAGSTLDAAGLLDAASSLELTAATIDTLGSFIIAGAVTLTDPTVTLAGTGTLALAGGSLGASGATTLVNPGATVTGGGAIGGASLTLTNEAAGVIDSTEGIALESGGQSRNAGLLEATAGSALSIGEEIITTIDNAGGTILANNGTVNLDGADIVGGTLAATNGGQVVLGSVYYIDGVTLDGGSAGLSVGAGTTLQAYYVSYDASLTLYIAVALTLLGTVEFAGAIIDGDPGLGGGPLTNEGLLRGSGQITGIVGALTVDNTGTLLAQGGMLSVMGDVADAGSIAIAFGATFELGDAAAATVDFRDDSNATLLLDQPTEFTGTFAHLTLGDTIDFGNNIDIKSAAVLGGTTLDVVLVNGTTMDYALSDMAAHTSFDVRASSTTPSEIYNFTYTGTHAAGEPSYSATGQGSLTVSDVDGSASLADVTAFSLTLDVTTNIATGPEGPGTDVITFDNTSLASFAATFGSGGTLTSLSLATGSGDDTNFPDQHVNDQGFTVFGLGSDGAETEDASDAGVSTTISTQGSIDVTSHAELLSALVVACFAEGTRIATVRGDVAVEHLAVGDRVGTRFGRLAPVRWLGWRHVACARHPRPRDVWPVRVCAHAFGPGQPVRDLLLSPDHAVFVGGALIPVRYLVNGESIVQEQRDTVTYWHVELDEHDVILAEGLPCESFLDTGNKAAFANGGAAVQLHPDFAQRRWDAESCAPLVVAGEQLERARAIVRERLSRAPLAPSGRRTASAR